MAGWGNIPIFRPYGGSSSGGSTALAVNSYSTTANLTSSNDVVLLDGTSGGFTVNLFTASGNSGKVLYLKRTDNTLANVVTIDPSGSETIDSLSTVTLNTQNECYVIVSDGSNWRMIDHKTDSGPTEQGPLTVTATTTNPTKSSTVVTDSFVVSRKGAYLYYHYIFEATANTGAADGSGTYLFALPSGLTVDTTKIKVGTGPNADTAIGYGSFNNGTNRSNVAEAFMYDSTHFAVRFASSGIFSTTVITNTSGFNTAAGWRLSFYGFIPISGWVA